jgi:retron-type reverse transcriptase
MYISKNLIFHPLILSFWLTSNDSMQALYALAVVPVAETIGDPNSYVFRDGRCCADAIKQCYNCLAKRRSAR